MTSELMQRLQQEAKWQEEYEVIDSGTVNPKYGNALADLILRSWQDDKDPWGLITSDPGLLEEFEKTFVDNSKEQACVELFRGTDRLEYLTLNKGDVLDYSGRYTSWSTDRRVSIQHAYCTIPILLVYKGPVVSLDLSKLNLRRKEHILPPMSFVVSDIINISGYTDSLSCEVAQESVCTNEGKGRIIFLEKLVGPS